MTLNAFKLQHIYNIRLVEGTYRTDKFKMLTKLLTLLVQKYMLS